MKAVFIGCVESSRILLQEILDQKKMEICGVVTKRASAINSDFFDLSIVSVTRNIDTHYYDVKENEEVLIHWLKEKSPDIILCFGWSHLISKRILATARLGGIGYHPTSLPANRGRHPIIWALVMGLTETASTFFMLDEGADVGNIVSQIPVAIAYDDTASSLYEKLMIVARTQVIAICNDLINDTFVTVPQDHSRANVWRKRTDRDSEIDWRMSAVSIYNLVRALNHPYPGAFFYSGQNRILVWESQYLNEPRLANIEPGKIVEVDGSAFVVKAGDGCIRIKSFEGEFSPAVGLYL